MQVSVEKVSSVERRLTITVPVSILEEAYHKQIGQFAKKSNIKGFRPGKAPLSYIKERFGADARRDALSEVIQQSLYQAVSEQKLMPINTPRIEPKVVAADKPLEFIASFEVMPEISDIQFTLDKVEKLSVEVTEEDVNRVLDHLSKQHASWQLVDRAAQEKDRVVIDYYPVYEGKAALENKVEGFPLELGSHAMIPGFEDGLKEVRAGEEKTLNLTFPTDFNDKDKAGKPVDFIVSVKQIFEADIPTINEQFIQKLGISSGKKEELMSQIQHSLEQECHRLIKEKIKEQVFSQLLTLNPIEAPPSLVEREAKNIHDEIYPPDQQHDHHQHPEQELAVFNEIAKKRIMLGLLIAEYAKQSHLVVDKERLQKRIEEIAAAYETPSEVIEWLSSDERRNGIEAQVMEDQVMDKLLEGIPETIKTMSYAELKGIRI